MVRGGWNRVAGLLVLSVLAAVGCKAQEQKITDPTLARQIEVLVRSQFNVPADLTLTIGARKPSSFPGYDSLTVTLGRAGKTSTVDFLISKDNKTLAHLESYSLTNIPALNIPTAGRPVRGSEDAKVTVINFDDLECPYCARMHQQLFPATLDRYKGLVKFVYKDYPLTEIHPWAMHASVDANCLADQNGNAYWGYVDYLHAHGQEVTGETRDLTKSHATLDKLADEQGRIFKLDAAKLSACLSKQDESAVRTSMHEGEALNVDGTPSLFIAGEHIYGAVPVEQVWLAIDRALKAQGIEPPPWPKPEEQQPTAAPALN